MKIENLKFKILPKKSLGQNFLRNPKILDRILDAGEVNADDIVLEVGPGEGTLTRKLSEKAKKVIAIEKDRRVIEPLKEEFKNRNIEIIEADVLKFDAKIDELKDNDYKIVANIPYYITSNLLRTIFEKWPRPKLIVLTIQKEVAQRIVAKPPQMSLLSLSIQFYADAKIIDYISAGSFYPKPKVDSAIIKLVPKKETPDETTRELFFKLIKAGFSEKRKQLVNNLSRKLDIDKNLVIKIFVELGIKEDARAETVDFQLWLSMARALLAKVVVV